MTKIRKERRDITADLTEIKRVIRKNTNKRMPIN